MATIITDTHVEIIKRLAGTATAGRGSVDVYESATLLYCHATLDVELSPGDKYHYQSRCLSREEADELLNLYGFKDNRIK